MVEGKLILTDSTHVKANASFKANVKVLAEQETTDYMERLDINEAQERKRLEDSGAIMMVSHNFQPGHFAPFPYFSALLSGQADSQYYFLPLRFPAYSF